MNKGDKLKINNIEVPTDLIFRYCNIIKEIEIGYSESMEQARKKLHDSIFESAGCHRSLYRKSDRDFSKELDLVVLELT